MEGTAPSGGCDADHVGELARVAYTATYYFYETSEGNGSPGQCP